MPTEIEGVKIQADTTSAWLSIPKRVQFSIWDTCDPIVHTDRFGFPIRDYLLFSHGMQSYNEVVYVATLRVIDEEGREDVDFYKVKVFTASAPEGIIEIIKIVNVFNERCRLVSGCK